MANIKSIEQKRAELPGSVVTPSRVTDPIVNRLVMISGSVLQRQRVGSVTKGGLAITFSPVFSGTPFVLCRSITSWPGSFIAAMKTLHSSGGTISVSNAGTTPVSVMAFDPSR